MKQKDIVTIVAVAIVSAIFSYIVAGLIFGGEESENLTAPIVQPISSDFPELDDRYYNAESLNPTKTINIGDTNNNDPF
jgi:hypothetical protein